MFTRIVGGKKFFGKWPEFDAAFKAAVAHRGDVKGLVNHRPVQDEALQGSGCSITPWTLDTDLHTAGGSPLPNVAMGSLEPLCVNQDFDHAGIRIDARDGDARQGRRGGSRREAGPRGRAPRARRTTRRREAQPR